MYVAGYSLNFLLNLYSFDLNYDEVICTLTQKIPIFIVTTNIMMEHSSMAFSDEWEQAAAENKELLHSHHPGKDA